MNDIDRGLDRRGLSPRLCQHVYPESHAKAGQCKGKPGASGYCVGHARSMGLLKLEPKLQQAQGEAQGSSPESLQELQAASAAAQERAQASLTSSAAAWLAKPETQRKLAKRWDDILERGSDAELIRLVKELTDRVEGRAGEAKPEPEPTVPSSLDELERMSDAELAALLD